MFCVFIKKWRTYEHITMFFIACGDKEEDTATAEPAAEASSEASTEPSGEASSEPSGEASSEPSGEAGSEPSGEASSEPSGEASSEPVAEASTEPSSEEPSGFCDFYDDVCGEWTSETSCADWWAGSEVGNYDADGAPQDTTGATQSCYEYHLV